MINQKVYRAAASILHRFIPAKHAKKVRLKDLAVGQNYYDKKMEDDWHNCQISEAYEVANFEQVYGGRPEFGPGMSECEIDEMINDAVTDDSLMLVHIDKIYKDEFDHRMTIDTTFGDIAAKDFLKAINTGEIFRMTDRDKDALYYIKHNVSLVSLAQAIGFTPVQKGQYYTLKEHDSVIIDPTVNNFYQGATDKGGDTIDFMMVFEGCTIREAFEKLRDKIKI